MAAGGVPNQEEQAAATGSTPSLADVLVDSGPSSTDFRGVDIETLERMRKMEDSSFKVRTLIASWERQQTQERSLRKGFAWGILIMLFLEVLLVGAAFFAIGFGYIDVAEWVAATFVMGVFSKIAAMTFFILKYLFPSDSSKLLSTIEKL